MQPSAPPAREKSADSAADKKGQTVKTQTETKPKAKTARYLHKLSAKDVQHARASETDPASEAPKEAKKPKGELNDGGGLLLRLRGESVGWVFRYTSPNGKRREKGLGAALQGSQEQAGESLTAARDAAHACRELLRRGIDPIEEAARQREAAMLATAAIKAEKARQHWTLLRCARDYHEREVEPATKSVHSQQWIRSIELHVPAALLNAPVDSITAPQLLKGLIAAEPHKRARRESGLGETLRRVRQRLEVIFEDAVFHERCAGNPAAAIGKKLGRARPKAESHLAALDYREAPALFAKLRAANGTAYRALEFAALTASRTGETLGARWSEVDFDSGTWLIPGSRMKKGRPHLVYLSSRAIEILRGQLGQDTALVFPTTMPGREGKPLSNMAMLTALDRLGIRDENKVRRSTVHGLCRATFSTWANKNRVAHKDVIEVSLAHQDADRVRAAYNRTDLDDFDADRRELMAKWATFLQGAQVIALRRGVA